MKLIEVNQRPYDDHSLVLEVQRLRNDIRDVKAQIERVAPYARLEDACLAYGREVVGALVGATDLKRELESKLAATERSLDQALVMQGLVQAELTASNHAKQQREMNDLLARLAEDTECDNWIRYHRGERFVQGNPAWGVPTRVGPIVPTTAPSHERIAAYRKLEAERNSIAVRSVAEIYHHTFAAHPEYLEIIDEPKRKADRDRAAIEADQFAETQEMAS